MNIAHSVHFQSRKLLLSTIVEILNLRTIVWRKANSKQRYKDNNKIAIKSHLK